MRKNIFSWKSLAGLALLFGLTMGLSSCEQVELPSNPSDPEPPVQPSLPDYDLVIGWYESNVTNKDIYPISITDSLERYKADIKAAGTYNVLVVTDRFYVSSVNNTTRRSSDLKYVNAIDIPAGLTDVTLNIDFSDKFKDGSGVMTVNDDNLDFVNLGFADGTTLVGLDLNLVATTMKLTGAATIGDLDVDANEYGVYQFYNNTFGDRGVTLDKGITVNAVYPERGFVIVADATVDALIVYNGSDEVDQNKVWGRLAGVENNELVKKATNGYYNDGPNATYTYQAVKNTDGSIHYLNSVKVRPTKSTSEANKKTDYTSIWAYTPTTPIEKVTVCANAHVYLKNVADNPEELHNEYEDLDEHVKGHSYVNHIVGLGSTPSATVSVGRRWYAFQDVKDVTNMIINDDFNMASLEEKNGDPKDVSANGQANPILRVYADLVNCLVNYGPGGANRYPNRFKAVYFFSTTQAVKGTEFTDAEKVLFYVDAKYGATAYNFNYDTCKVPAGCKLGVVDYDVESAVLDADGNPVTYDVWHYVVYKKDAAGQYYKEVNEYGELEWAKDLNADGTYKWEITTEGLDKVPEPARLEGNVWYHKVQAIESDIRINDMTITIGLGGTKIGTTALTPATKVSAPNPNFMVTINNIRDLWPAYQYRAEMNYKYHFGTDQLYRQTFDNTMGWWMFVTTN